MAAVNRDRAKPVMACSAAGAGCGAGLVGCASSCRDSWWWAMVAWPARGRWPAAVVLRLADANRRGAGGVGG